MVIILLFACPENGIAFLQICLRTMLELPIPPVKLEVGENWAFFFFFLSSCHPGLWDPRVNSKVHGYLGGHMMGLISKTRAAKAYSYILLVWEAHTDFSTCICKSNMLKHRVVYNQPKL